MNIKNPKFPKQVSFRKAFGFGSAVVFVAILLTALFVSAGFVSDVSEPWIRAPYSEASYVIGRYNSTHYYAKNYTGYGTEANKGYEFLSSNQSDVVMDALQKAKTVHGAHFYFMNGNYSFDSTILIPTMPQRSKLIIEGETRVVNISSTADKVFDFEATAYAPAGTWHWNNLELKNLRIEHTTRTNASIALDLQYITTTLENIQIVNKNATRQGIGIFASPTANDGGATWQNVFVADFSVNYWISQDHIPGIFLMSEDAGHVDFILDGFGITLIHPQTFRSSTNVTTAIRFQITGLQRGIALINAEIERDSGGAYIFDLTAAGTGIINVYGLQRVTDTGDPVVSAGDLANFRFEDCKSFVTSNSGTATIANAEWVAHGLATTPTTVSITLKAWYGTLPIVVGCVGLNATHFQVGAKYTNNTLVTVDAVQVYWYASLYP